MTFNFGTGPETAPSNVLRAALLRILRNRARPAMTHAAARAEGQVALMTRIVPAVPGASQDLELRAGCLRGPKVPAVSIVIPAYNEEQRLGPTLQAVHQHLTASGWSFEIVVVDDGSTDGTVALCRTVGERLGAVRSVGTGINVGKGHAVRLGMLAARGAVRVMMDADGSTPVACLDALVAPVLAGVTDVAIGSRYLPGSQVTTRQPWLRRVISRACNAIIRAVLLPGMADTQCGFKAFSAGAAERIFPHAVIAGWSADLEVLALARRAALQVQEVPVQWADDPRSKVKLSHALVTAPLELLAIWWRLGRKPAMDHRKVGWSSSALMRAR